MGFYQPLICNKLDDRSAAWFNIIRYKGVFGMPYETLHNFLPAIQSLRLNKSFTKKDLIIDDFLLGQETNLKMFYAPHNEYVNNQAKIVIVGITPGWQQMKMAFMQFIKSLATHTSLESCLYDAKIAARFSGTMRTNLINMLDQCHIPGLLNVPSSAQLFERYNPILHTTSIIKYPVFINGKNYTGHQPSAMHSPLLKHYIYHAFPTEMRKIRQPALVIPLGKAVEQIIFKLIEEQILPHHHYVSGFPHPSGANGHRTRQFKQEKHQLREAINRWSLSANIK